MLNQLKLGKNRLEFFKLLGSMRFVGLEYSYQIMSPFAFLPIPRRLCISRLDASK